LIVDHNRFVHITWHDFTDYAGSGTDADIFYKYKTSGGSWSTTEVVSTESTEESGFPSLIVDSSELVHVTWQDHTDYGGAGGDWDIFYKYKTSSGSWSPSEVVSTESKYLSEFPSLKVDSDDVVHVVWMDKSSYGGSSYDLDIFYKYRTNSDSWSITEVVSTESTNYSYYPSLSVDSSDIVHITWYDYTDYDGSGIDADIFYKNKNVENQPPKAPLIYGENSGKIGKEYEYEFTATDPDNDNIAEYIINWGDGTPDEIISGPFASGEKADGNHTYADKGDYTITAKAKDIYGLIGPEGTLDVNMPKKRLLTNTIFMRFLAQFPVLHRLFLFL
jgi:hypothetical protein